MEWLFVDFNNGASILTYKMENFNFVDLEAFKNEFLKFCRENLIILNEGALF